MALFFIAVAVVILAVAVTVFQTLREKRAREARYATAPARPKHPEAAGPVGGADPWR